MRDIGTKVNVLLGKVARGSRRLSLPAIIAASLSLAGGQMVHAQPAPANVTVKQYDLAQAGTQTVVLGRLPYGAQKAGRARCTIHLEKGEASGTLVLRMLSKEGEDLAPQQKLLGWHDPTREVALNEIKAGKPLQVSADFVTASGTAAVSVELKIEAKTSPCTLRVEGLALEERKSEAVASEEGGQLVTSPEKGFVYGRNLVPALDSAQWRPVGDAAKRAKGPAGQTVLILEEKVDGRWESPVTPLEAGAKELSLQAFIKFDAMARPNEHPFRVQFQNAQGQQVPAPQSKRGWPCWEWNHIKGQWMPLSVRFAVPQGAVSAQLVIELAKGSTSPWNNKGEITRNNFIVFQTAGLRLWAHQKASPADMAPFNITAWAGGAADAGPFTPCSSQQQNSIALETRINNLNNLYFSKDGKWPAPRAWVENYLPIRRSVELKGEVFDWAGVSLGKVATSVKLEPFEVKDVELPVDSANRAGTYSLAMDASQDGVIVGQGVIRWGYFKEPNERADRLHDQYSFGFHPLFTAQGGDSDRYMDLECRVLKAMGVRGFRLQCRLWGLNGVDSDKAIASVREYSDRFHKQVWPYMQRYGFDGYITFFPKPSAEIPANGSPEMEAWKKYVAEAVKAYPEISVFAFGNEEIGSSNKDVDTKPGIWGYKGSMRDYTREFKAAREAALQARPEITFIVGQAADPQANVARLFFEAGGTAKDVQGWAINSYGNAPGTWKNLVATLKKNGVDLTNAVGLIPEIGYGAQRRGPSRRPAEKGEAIQMVCHHVETLANAPWIREISWFTLVSRWEVVHNFFFDTDWSPKPMVGAYLTASSTLGAGRPTRVADLPDVNAYLWQRPDGSKAGVIWASGRQRLRLKVGETSSPVIVRDIMGNDTEQSPQGGVVSVEVSQAPIYLLNIQSLADGAQTSEAWTLTRTKDGQRQAKVEIRNRTDKALNIEGHFEGVTSVVWSHPDVPAFTLAPGESKVVSDAFTLTDQDFADSKTLTLMLKIDGVAVASDCATSLLTARRTATPPTSDGKGWEKADTIVLNQVRQVVTHGTPRWKGPEDLSARPSVLWDDQNLYFRAEVKDDIDMQVADADRAYLYDSIQLGFTASAADKDAGGTELALGVSNGRPTVIRRAGGASGVAGPESVRLNVARDENSKTTVYQAAIAWKALNVTEPKAGLRLRFAILINDGDQQNPSGETRQAIQWFSGIFEKATSRYGDLTLCD